MFNIGDYVVVRDDLIVGREYSGDLFSPRMKKFAGKKGRIISFTKFGYKIDIDPIHVYTKEMIKRDEEKHENDSRLVGITWID